MEISALEGMSNYTWLDIVPGQWGAPTGNGIPILN